MPKKTPPVPMPVDHAYCFGCASVLPTASFYPDRRQIAGHGHRCKSCVAKQAKLNRTFRAEVAAKIASQYQPTPLPDDYAPEVLFHAGHLPDYERIDRFRRMDRLKNLCR